MLSLLKCELKKFRSTYINSLSFLGMLLPLLLTTAAFIARKDDFVKNNSYNWENFNQQLTIFFTLLVGPIITSFIAVFSVFYEYQEKTMKNILASPHDRIIIVLAKLVHISGFVIVQYIVVAIVQVLCAYLLGFDVTADKIVGYGKMLIVAGVSTIAVVPLMMFVTFIFRNFIPAMVLTVVGVISNVLVLNWEKSYLSLWAAPMDISYIASLKSMKMNLLYPVTSCCIYFIVFMLLALVYFKNADQHA